MFASISYFVGRHWLICLLLLLLSCSLCYGYAEETLYFETVEEQPPGTLIGHLPSLSTHKYRVSGNEEAKRHIELDTSNGTLRVKQRVDRESLKTDQLILAFIDEDSLSVKTVKIRVNDINDNNPQFASSFYNVTILETAILATRISLPFAFDPDKAENGTIVSYQLQSSSNTFSIVSSSNNDNESASLYLTSQLNYSTQNSYELVLLAFDGGQPNRKGQITINISVQDSNEAPQFEDQNFNVSTIARPAPNLPLLKVKAVDLDTGYNGQIYYQIQTDPTSQFVIDKESGEIYVKPEVEFLNCNQSNGQNTCLITVEAIDGGNPPLKSRKIVRIHVNESGEVYIKPGTNKPLLIVANSPTILVKTSPNGYSSAFVNEKAKCDSVVAVLTIKDNNQGLAGNADLRIVSGNDGNWFRLESGNNFGIIRVVRLESIKQRRFYELLLEAKDKRTPSRLSQHVVKLTIYDDKATYKYLDETNNQMYSICKDLPCYNGTCNPTLGCQCFDKYGGAYCNERSFAFKFDSSLELKMPKTINKFSMQFRSVSSNGLLLSSYSNNTKEYFSIELLNGKLHLHGESNGQSISLPEIPFSQSENYTTLTLNTDTNSTTILIDSNKWEIDYQTFNDKIFIGSIPDFLLDSRRISNPNFYGCVKSIQMDNQHLDESYIVKEHLLMQSCPFNNHELACSKLEAQNACQNERCVNSWEGFYCVSSHGFHSTNSRLENETVTSAGGRILLKPSRYSRQKLASISENNKQLVYEIDEQVFYWRHNYSHDTTDRIDNWPSQWTEIDIRTRQSNATLLKVQSDEKSAVLSIINGQIHYSLIDLNDHLLTFLYLNGTLVNDKQWHRITIEIGSDSKSIRLQVDDQQIERTMHLKFPQFLSPTLDYIEIGSASFYGCFRRLLLNNQLYALVDFNAKLLEKQFFQISTKNGTFNRGCSDRTLCSMNNDCPMGMFLNAFTLRELIILIIILLLVVICVIIGFKLRKRLQKRQKLICNIQRISNLQLISTCDSEFAAHDNATYSSFQDFTYMPSYASIYGNVIYPSNDVCSCHLKFDYEDNTHRMIPNYSYLQDGVVTKFNMSEFLDSQDCSISSSSTDIPLDPSLNNLAEQDYRLHAYHNYEQIG